DHDHRGGARGGARVARQRDRRNVLASAFGADLAWHAVHRILAVLAIVRVGIAADFADAIEVHRPEDEIHAKAKGHADGGRADAPMPTDFFAECAGDEGAEEGAEVDAHVEDGEGAIAAGVALGVELANHDGDAWFEVAGADDNQGKTEDKDRHTELAL